MSRDSHRKDVDKICEALDTRFARFGQFKQVSNAWETLAIGHFGKAKVLHYDVQKMIHSGALLTAVFAKGTAFTMDWTVAAACFSYCILGAVAFCLVYFLDGDGFLDTSKFETIALYLNSFVPFILSLYMSLNLTRWWVMRVKGIGEVLDATENCILLLSALLPGKEYHELHDQVIKYALASVSLIVNSSRGIEEVDVLGPKRDKLLTDEEVKIISKIAIRPRAAVMWSWIASICVRSLEDHAIGGGKQRDCIAQCVQARDGISLIWSHLGTQLPFAYVHLVILLVNLNNLVMCLKCGVVMATDIMEENYIHAISQALFIFIVPLLYQGLLAVTYIINNPFGDDLLDFPIMAFQEWCNEAACAVSEYSWMCPVAEVQWAPEASKRDIALRQGKGLREAEAIEAGVQAVPDPPIFRRAFEASSTTSIAERKMRESLMEEALREQLRIKDEVIQALQQQNKLLQSNLSATSDRLQKLETKAIVTSSLLVVPSGTHSRSCSRCTEVENPNPKRQAAGY